jgi:hypothetical protein
VDSVVMRDRTSTSVRRSVGPDPRIVGDDNWVKLVWAGLNLNEPNGPAENADGSYSA